MEYIHVKNLEKYHPGYKDRTLQWAKIYINMADGDPDTELITNEIDWSRLIKLILLELRAQKPLPNINNYWQKKGFNLDERPMSLTIQMLHNFIDIVTEENKDRYESVTQIREEEDKEKSKNAERDYIVTLQENPAYKHIDIPTELLKMEGWLSAHPSRKLTRRFIINWLHKIEKPVEIKNNGRTGPKPFPKDT